MLMQDFYPTHLRDTSVGATLPKQFRDAVVLADNARVTDELHNFARGNGRGFMFSSEEPANHWYFSAGIGLSFKRTDPAS